MKLYQLITGMVMNTILLSCPLNAHASTILWSKGQNTNYHSQNKRKVSASHNIIPHTASAPWETSDGKPYLAPMNSNHEIYYDINPNQPNNYQELWHQAMDNWSNLGVVKMVQVTWGNPNAKLHLNGFTNYTQMPNLNNYRNIADDYANTDMTTSNTNNNAIITSANLTLYPDVNSLKNVNNRLNVAEHEIGHALGFAHDAQLVMSPQYNEFVPVVMNAVAINYKTSLGTVEKQGLADHY